ncbi:uncharacterized protein LOC128740561 [Sabethes cyaneus]|uniref:uncharacterized protein LOC128740561 n=1 Tax=Sabethes cyaneus TaxID=53552 RepID=UPI00237D4D0E|nr:uncharacterized protein LOC128740561 [Sabethes cyaneus]
MSLNDDLRTLLKRERTIYKRVTVVEAFIKNYHESNQCEVEVRLQVLEDAYKDFFPLRESIELMLDESDGPSSIEGSSKVSIEEAKKIRDDRNTQQLAEFENKYCAVKSQLLKLRPIPEPHQATCTNHVQAEQTASFTKIKLPEIRLPSFSGKTREWIVFRDTFLSLIQQNPNLNSMDKFTYLKSSLTGEALQEINSIELSAANYEVAWKALQGRYENKKLIVKSHLDAIFSLEPLRKETCDGLHHLVSEFEKNLQMLDKLGEKTANWSTLLAYMMCSKLDATTQRHWEVKHNSKEVPMYQDLIIFLRNQCSVLQSVIPQKTSAAETRQFKSSVCHSVVKVANKCPFCGEPRHSPFQCTKFQRMKVSERNEAVMKARLCRNCLYPGHYAGSCEKGVCHHCRQKHHSMLHAAPVRSSVPPSQTKPPTANPTTRQAQPKPQHSNQQAHTHSDTALANTTNSHNTDSQASTSYSHATDSRTSQTYVALPETSRPHQILLSTAIVKVKDRFGNTLLARALLDSCSQHCLMTKEFSRKLKFRVTPTYLSVQGIGSSQCVSTKLVAAEVAPRSRKFSSFEEHMQFFVLPKLTVSLPTSSFNVSEWNLPDSTFLADPGFNASGPIDIIIGAEYYLDLLTEGKMQVVSGRAASGSTNIPRSIVNVCSTADIQEQLTKFWELETCHSATTNSVEESACEEMFEKTTVRDEMGRFVVTLPKKDHLIGRLGDSKTTALKRFGGMERRLTANSELRKQYSAFIHEYEDLGHMREVVDEEPSNQVNYYLPHHAVLKPESTTTKLRVVFDASCRTSTGVSLNNALLVGPVVQDDLLNIILRFRLHRYAIVADIAKMYRMIRMQPADQRLQRIVWRDSEDQPVRTYELCTVTYRTAAAPYLATRCLQKLAEEGAETHPEGAKVLKNDFYVDDMLSGADDVEKGKRFVAEMISLMESAGMSLRKWNSNCEEILSTVPEALRDERSVLELDSSNSTVKTLGLAWEPHTDCFKFSTPKWNETAAITKRTVVSDVSRLFDPLGLVGPVVVQAKIYIQELWKLECNWDDPLSSEFQEQWQEYRRNMRGLDGLSIPRWIGFGTTIQSQQIHGFCDASEKAYGACIYLRIVLVDGTVSVQLFTAKSRVAPLENLKKKKKRQTIPRLELSSALLLAHLYEKVVSSTNINAQAHFWTDSMIVKCWLASPPSRWKEFVANRVSEIQHITKEGTWNHVAGVENPADIISRGMSPAQLQYQSVWWYGPNWLSLDEDHWPQPQQNSEEFDPSTLEEKGVVVAVAQSTEPWYIFYLFSSFSALVKATAAALRFGFNSQPANNSVRKVGPITVKEFDDALRVLVRMAQKESFLQEYIDLTNGRQVRKSSRIASLNPQLVDGILCVGGRLQNATISSSRKHPYILDHRHPITKLVVTEYHQKLFHAGQQVLISSVREKYWPTSVRTLARKVIHDCVRCFRARPKIQEQLMADLPSERVTKCIPFQRVGIDYCGPFQVTYPQRQFRPVKCFVAIYVCLVTKAVYIDLAADLTTRAFLDSLTRFTSRHGKPSIIMCDNAKNFVGAKRQLDDMLRLFHNQNFQNSVIKQAADDKIDFCFIPARSPNFGGLWESAVKSFKTLLKRTIGLRSLVYDEFHTIVAQIEAILNSRPLTPLSNDPDDFEALTPGHFVAQRPLVAIPEPDLHDVPENRLSAWQRMQKDVQLMWKRWSTQYLSDLHNRTKWTRKRDNVKIGTMVLLKEENLPPLKWLLGRITDIHPGSDGNVRVVTVRTKDGSYRRAISKICVLPISDNL